jgi:PiT family inorganic phosphate transporter
MRGNTWPRKQVDKSRSQRQSFGPMSQVTAATAIARPQGRPTRFGLIAFGLACLSGAIYVGTHLIGDLSQVQVAGALPYLLLSVALIVALAFEFVNGFHDTANAVATVIYTRSLDANVAVVWSGVWNFIGVLTSTGAVAFGIISLLPVELILQVGSSAGFAMVFALLIAAIIWNLGTWYFGLPSSSSHTLVGSIIGVGIANELMSPKTGTSGVDWTQAAGVGESLLLSPIVGFAVAGLLLLLAKALIPNRALYEEPRGAEPPPLWIRGLLIFTCMGVSFAHGSNDGQKGMGLIMLILIGTVPTAYALNHAVSAERMRTFVTISRQADDVIAAHAEGTTAIGEPRDELSNYLHTRMMTPGTMVALRQLINDITNELSIYEGLRNVPEDRIRNFRNDLYVVSESIRLMLASGTPAFSASERQVLTNYRQEVDAATKFIPGWVKVAVAIALGLGTMVGWKRIVVTVGEKIGKSHLTYAQGAAAEITAMMTIGAADQFGLPVSTTHVLSSGVAGTMAANRSGVQMATVRNLLIAWMLTLPVSICLAGFLFWAFRKAIF